jgi:hypothetical protein
MKQIISRAVALSVSAALVFAPMPSEALPPLIAMLVKDAIKQTFKDMLLDSLRGQGCKGIALANAITALDLKGGAGALPKMPAGMAMPTMPPGMAMPNMPAGMAMPNMPAGAGMLPGAMGGAGMPADMMARMAGNMPPGMALSPEQSAMVANMMKTEPLSPKETFETIDEMAELGFLPKALQTEMKECMVLLPQTIAPLGMAMGMIKPMISQLREAKAMMLAATPEEQDEMIAALEEQFDTMSDSDRKMAVDMLEGGLFPPRVSNALKAKLAKK